VIFAVIKKQSKAKKIIIEKHVKLKNSKGPDASTSITTEQLKELTSQIRIIEKIKFVKL
jgi:sialic acid synthase SpsE